VSSSSALRSGPAGAISATRAPALSGGGIRIWRNVESAIEGHNGMSGRANEAVVAADGDA
jgi:hypothetical protein